jgi:anti-anti-sigma factor
MDSNIRVTPVGSSAVVVCLTGDHDCTTADAFLEEATAALAGCEHLVVDLSDATFIDSTLLKALQQVRGEAANRGATFDTVVGENRHVRDVIGTVHLTSGLSCRTSLAELLLRAAAHTVPPQQLVSRT